jgi:hypothetical protein
VRGNSRCRLEGNTLTHPDKEPEDDWKPPPRIVVDLSIPDGVVLVIVINGIQLMPDEAD